MQRFSDQEMFDVQQLFGLLMPSRDQIRVLRERLNTSKADQTRAAAVLAMHLDLNGAVDLLLDPNRNIAETAWEYVGNNPLLDQISQALEVRDPAIARNVAELSRRRAALISELDNVPSELRRWRAEFFLQNRKSALSTPSQLLTPGIAIWLRRTYGVTGDAGL